MESPVTNQLLLGQRTRVVPLFVLGCIHLGAFHQENTYCQTHLGVSDRGDSALPLGELLALDTREPSPHEPE